MAESLPPGSPARASSALLIALLSLSGTLGGPAEVRAQPGAQARPVFFAPLRVAKEVDVDGALLKDALAAEMLASGRFAEAVSAVTEQAVGECIRQVNRDVNDSSCWIRLGQGQGAELMASGKIAGTRRECTVSLRLTELESRLSRHMHVAVVRPCRTAGLLAEMRRGAQALSGNRRAGGASASIRSPAPDAPPTHRTKTGVPPRAARRSRTEALTKSEAPAWGRESKRARPGAQRGAPAAAPEPPGGTRPPAPDEAQPRWISLQGGSFTMGSRSGDGDERPPHTVRVPSFRISATEVTVAEYRRCVEAGVCSAERLDGGSDWAAQALCTWDKPDRADHPVNCLDWGQAQTYAAWLGHGARLCSEAEWEYAARSGGKPRTYPWGDTAPTCARAHMDDERRSASGWKRNGCGTGITAPVCSTKEGLSEQGVCDLAGNVSEWVADPYTRSYAGAPTDGSARPLGRSARAARVHRGGRLKSTTRSLRSTRRDRAPARAHFFEIGLRVCGPPPGE